MPAYEELKCPDCNGPMKSRSGKFGKFWGCIDFPQCRGTRDSEGRSKEDRARDRDMDDRVRRYE
jgi:ssDNA-binding Zn-finger/Zn-ribbon topoisomerase 1